MIIALDGPAAVGKGTLAHHLATRFNLAHLDTGMLYRAVAARMRNANSDVGDPLQALVAARDFELADLDRPIELRDEETGKLASFVAAHAEVRREMVKHQRAFARYPPGGVEGAILDGRDIGTVVLPAADVKIFVTASIDTRIERRFAELRMRGVPCTRADVGRDLKERDRRDRTRDVAPLIAASDAFLLDTTELDASAAFNVARQHVLATRQSNEERPGH